MRFCKILCKITQNFGYSLILAQNKVVNIYFVKESLQLKYCVRDSGGLRVKKGAYSPDLVDCCNLGK